MTHTPGPWNFDAAAPDLLTALTETLELTRWLIRNAPDNYWIDWMRTIEIDNRVKRAESAIAKTKGE